DSRYLLVLTENYAALGILQQQLVIARDAIIIFGSNFPKDLDNTHICRNINRIKICMESGRTVILLNMESLYESLYDALNMYYVTLGGEKFVDLALGTQRVKCQVHKDFRLLVVAEKEVVYKRFPIPLINRLEKHILSSEKLLLPYQQAIQIKLSKWTKTFPGEKKRPSNRNEIFIGFHEDTIASIILQVCQDIENCDQHAREELLMRKCKESLLLTATPDSILRLCELNGDHQESNMLSKVYFEDQPHSSLRAFLADQQHEASKPVFARITTYGHLPSGSDRSELAECLEFPLEDLHFMHLTKFDHEQQFSHEVTEYMKHKPQTDKGCILLLLCKSGQQNAKLIACAQHIIFNERVNSCPFHNVYVIVQLSRTSQLPFVGFSGSQWVNFHLDDLIEPTNEIAPLKAIRGKSLSSLMTCDGVNIDKLLYQCIHVAVGAIADPQNSEMKMRRVDMLMQLMGSKGTHSYAMTNIIAQAECQIAKVVGEGQVISPLLENVFEAANVLCSQSEKDGPRSYLLKQIVRIYSYDTAIKTMSIEKLRWLLPHKIFTIRNDRPDHFLACGTAYVEMRRAVAEYIIDQNSDRIKDTLKNDQVGICVFLLSLHRTITQKHRYEDEGMRPSNQTLNNLKTIIDEDKLLHDYPLTDGLLNNKLEGLLHCRREEPVSGLTQFAMHLHAVLIEVRQNSLCQLLAAFSHSPYELQDLLFPTMPEDNAALIRAAIQDAKWGEGVLYSCPSGHPYLIGDCGKPNASAKCPEGDCGLPIGGQKYDVPMDGNTPFSTEDQTEFGHILGPANKRDAREIGIRSLTPTSTAIIRCILHCAMSLGKVYGRDLSSVVKRADLDVYDFLEAHLQHDLKQVQASLGLGIDDAFLVLHSILYQIKQTAHHDVGNKFDLTQKADRTEWERQFSKGFIEPVIKVSFIYDTYTCASLNTLHQMISRVNIVGFGTELFS
ncbi:hypothetical protein CAPTEDRAFT_198285, partial [Capitella teleta]